MTQRAKTSINSSTVHVVRAGEHVTICGAKANWTGTAVIGKVNCRRCLRLITSTTPA